MSLSRQLHLLQCYLLGNDCTHFITVVFLLIIFLYSYVLQFVTFSVFFFIL